MEKIENKDENNGFLKHVDSVYLEASPFYIADLAFKRIFNDLFGII